MKTVNFVATADRIRADFPSATYVATSHARPGIVSADYPIDPADCATNLGRWLAERIFTTRFDDDASRCVILLPTTEEGLHFRERGEWMLRQKAIRTDAQAEALFADLERWIAQRRAVVAAYGDTSFTYRVVNFQWPVYGSAAAGDANTPAAYFDLCAKLIRQTGGVILRAGLGGDMLPDSLARTMATDAGGGDALLGRYHGAQAGGADRMAATTTEMYRTDKPV